MENYEALGRYVTAKEQAEKFRNERDVELTKLSNMTRNFGAGNVSGHSFAIDYDADQLAAFLKRANEAHQNMIEAVNEANVNAETCDKPRLVVRTKN